VLKIFHVTNIYIYIYFLKRIKQPPTMDETVSKYKTTFFYNILIQDMALYL
jgi:hypothetical protein